MSIQSCEGISCSKPAKFQCPTCISIKLQTHFCSQECFKKSWFMHKHLHTANNLSYDPFPQYNYTGSLRACYPLSKKRLVPTHIKRPDYATHGLPESEMALGSSNKIRVLKEDEIAKARKACELSREVLEEGAKAIRVGITTDELDEIIHNACIKRNCYPSPLNYHGFPKSVCTSVNEVICHGIPDKRPLEDGDIVNLDVSIYYDGYHGDLNETYLVGTVNEQTKKLVKCAQECLDEAIKAVKPGMLYRNLGKIIEDHATKNGFSVVRTYQGHGIHELFHCAPSVPHYAGNKAVGVMKPGHIFTIEPMICIGGWRDVHWPDQWTAVTADGKPSAQFEETLLVTENGCEILYSIIILEQQNPIR